MTYTGYLLTHELAPKGTILSGKNLRYQDTHRDGKTEETWVSFVAF